MNACKGGLERGLVATVDGHPGAGCGEDPGDLRTDATRTAGDERRGR
jgi:hypothetical protein